MPYYRARHEMVTAEVFSFASNKDHVAHILRKADEIKDEDMRVRDAALGLVAVKSTADDRLYEVDLVRKECTCAGSQVICSHLHAAARLLGGERRCAAWRALRRVALFDTRMRRWGFGERQLYRKPATDGRTTPTTGNAAGDAPAPEDATGEYDSAEERNGLDADAGMSARRPRG